MLFTSRARFLSRVFSTHPTYVLPELVRFWGLEMKVEDPPPPFSSRSPPSLFPYGPALESEEELSLPPGHNAFTHHLESFGHTMVFEQIQGKAGLFTFSPSPSNFHPPF